jgi:hypothetical protein
MNIYHVFVDRAGEEPLMAALAFYSRAQDQLLGETFPEITHIETWDGYEVYERKTVH